MLGLLMAPLARPVLAMPADMMDMSADMPCCQDKAPMPDCTQDCPFIALCVAGTVLNIPASPKLSLVHKIESVVFPANNAIFTSLNHDPPLRPPQS